jgi:hypothetical protein
MSPSLSPFALSQAVTLTETGIDCFNVVIATERCATGLSPSVTCGKMLMSQYRISFTPHQRGITNRKRKAHNIIRHKTQ